MPEIRDGPNSVQSFEVNQNIRFEEVTFKYPKQLENQKNVFDKISLSIKAHETTAIVGPSGSGKSTIVQIIERFYDPKEGDVFFDNTNVKDLSLKTLRESIGYVS